MMSLEYWLALNIFIIDNTDVGINERFNRNFLIFNPSLRSVKTIKILKELLNPN